MKSLTPKPEARQLEKILIERRFGGFLPVLQFVDGKTENASVHVFGSPAMALDAAQDYIKQPAYNIAWWVK